MPDEFIAVPLPPFLATRVKELIGGDQYQKHRLCLRSLDRSRRCNDNLIPQLFIIPDGLRQYTASTEPIRVLDIAARVQNRCQPDAHFLKLLRRAAAFLG